MTILDLPKLSRKFQLTGQTWLIDIYALLPKNVSFLECFWRFHIYFIRYCNNPTEITQNQFCDVFEKPKILARDVCETSQRRQGKDLFFEMHLRRLEDVTKKISFLRSFWEVSEISVSMEIWLRSLRDISYQLERFWMKKNCASRLSIKIFIKSKTRAGKFYAYQILLGFKTSVTCKNILTSCQTAVCVVKQPVEASSRKLFWAAIAVVNQTAEVWGTLSPMVASRKKTSCGFHEQMLWKNHSNLTFLRSWYVWFLTVEASIIVVTSDHFFVYYPWIFLDCLGTLNEHKYTWDKNMQHFLLYQLL